MLGAAEELSEFVVSRQRRVFDIGLQPQHIAQAGFGEPDDVVVLVPGPSDIAKLGVASHSSPSLICLSSRSRPPTRDVAAKTVTRAGSRLVGPSGFGFPSLTGLSKVRLGKPG